MPYLERKRWSFVYGVFTEVLQCEKVSAENGMLKKLMHNVPEIIIFANIIQAIEIRERFRVSWVTVESETLASYDHREKKKSHHDAPPSPDRTA